MRLRRPDGESSASTPRPEELRRSEAGDTLVEVLIALVVVGIAATAILLAFATSISGSGSHRNAATLDTMLRTAAAEATSFVQQQPTAFGTCAAVNPTTYPTVAIPLPNDPAPAIQYSASVTGVQYWNSTTYAFSSPPQGPTAPCPSPTSAYAGGPQQLTVTVTASNGTSQSITTVVQNPNAPTAGTPCTLPASKLVWVQQPNNGFAGSALFPPPILALEDSTGCVVTNDFSQVTLAKATGPGTLSNCIASRVSGETIFQNCSLNALGSYTLVASDPTDGITTAPYTVPSSPPFTITAGVATQLAFTQEPGNGTGGVALSPQPQVTIEDSQGNPVLGDTSTVTLAIGTNPGGGTLSGCTAPAVNGVATFTGCAIDKGGYGYTLTATDTADNLTTPSSPSSPFNVLVLTSFQVVPSTNNATAGSAFNVTITAEDQSGATFPLNGSQAIAFSGPANSPNNTAPAYPASVNFTAGVGTASVTLYDAQSTTLTATLGSASGTSNAVTVKGTGTASAFSVTNPGTQTAGTPFNVTVTALDTYGNTATTYTGAQALVFTGPANSPAPSNTAPTYPASVTFSAGVGTASVTLTDAQSTTLTATKTITGTSTAFTVNPAAPSKFTVSNPGTQTAGTAFGVTVTAFDTYGNTATNFTGAQAITFTGPSSSPNGNAPVYPASVTFANGAGIAAGITLTDAQSTTLTATQGSANGTSTSFTVNGTGTTTNFALSRPSPIVASSFTETLTADDTYGNPTPGYSGIKSVVFSGPANSPNGTGVPVYPASVTFTSGVGPATITLYDAQTTTLTATQGSVTGTSASFTVTSSSAATKYTVTNPGTQTAGTPFNVTVTALDTYGNTATTYTGAQALVFTGPANSPAPSNTAPTYPASVTFSAGVGTASVTLTDAQSTTLTATKTITGTSTAFTVNPAAPSKFTVSNPGTQTAGTAFGVTVTAFDTYGNTATNFTGAQAITFTGPSSSPNGNAPVYPASVTFANGAGIAAGITLTDAQSTTLTATQGSANGTSTSFTVNGTGTTTNFALSRPSPIVASSFTETLTADDTYGNPTPGYSGIKSVVFSGPANSPNGTGLPVYPASVTFTSGVGPATITLYDAQSTTLTATQGSVTGTSASFTVTSSSAATKYTVTNPGTQTAGTPFNVTVTALDTYGNTATTYTGAQALVFTGPANSPAPSNTAPTYPASVTFSAGVGTASVTLTDAQSTTLTATKTITGTSTAFTVNPAAPSKFTVSNPGTQTAGTAFGVTVTAFDTYGNTATNFTGAQAITFTGPSSSPNGNAPVYPASVTFANGAGIAAGITLTDAQSTTLTATQGSANGTSTSFGVQAAAQSTLGLTAVTQPSPALTCAAPVGQLTACTSTGEGSLNGNGNAGGRTVTANIQLLDTYGNVVTNTGSSITVSVASSGNVSSFAPSSGSLTIPNGQSTTTAQFTLVRSSGGSQSATMTAKIGTTTELTVTLSS